MAASQTEIVNLALQKCAEPKIENLDQDVKSAREATTAWNPMRKAAIQMYRWNFAKRRKELAASATAPAFGFQYQFPVPNNFLQLIGIFDDNQYQQNYTGGQIPYVTEGTGSQKIILADESPLLINYLEDVTDTSQFDPLFDQVLACHLAMQLAYPLGTSLDRLPQIERELDYWLKRAKLANAIENTPELYQASTWVDSRYAGDNQLRIGPVV